MFASIRETIKSLEASESIFCSGICDLGMRHVWQSDDTALNENIINVSPNWEEIDASQASSTATSQGKQRRLLSYETLLKALTTRLIERYLSENVEPAPIIILVSKDCLMSIPAMIEELRKQLPRHALLIVTSITQSDLQNEKILQGLLVAQALYQSDRVEKIIVVDETTKHAHSDKVANALVGLLLLHRYCVNARPFNDVLKDWHREKSLSGLSAFAGFAFASVSLSRRSRVRIIRYMDTYSFYPNDDRFSLLCALDQFLPLAALYEWWNGGKVKLDTKNVPLGARETIRQCVEDQSCTAYPIAVDSSLPGILVASLPVELPDARFQKIGSSLRELVQDNYPRITFAAVRSDGWWFSTPYNAQAFLLYQLPNILSGESVQ